MMHKSFKPAKCKTALKLAASRIKLLKNRKEAQVKLLKRELAQLLEAGQDQTARMRVEHVVREEKTLAAYDLIAIYCELIAARLPIIESQKSCPIDLKEPIASVIFASPRCVDIPELMDVRKHLTAKYGKEFTSAAVELRPDCGVSRLMVEKLSAKAPDGPAKIKILSAIAEEHNIKWEHKSFEEKYSQPPGDLLNGPSTLEQASNFHVKPQNVQEPMNGVDKIPPNLQVPYGNQDLNLNTLGQNSTPSAHSGKFPSADLGSNNSIASGTSHPNLRPSGSGAERMEFRNPNQHESGFSSGRQSWPMEFKDATSAAQAAAESAERASIAARAAVELSSQGRISRQHSGKSQKSSSFVSGDQRRQGYAGLTLKNEYTAKDPVNSFRAANYGMPDNQIDGEEQDDLAGLAVRFYNLKNSNKTSDSASSKLTVDDYTTVNNPQKIDTPSHNRSSESERNFTGRVEDGMKADKVNFSREPSIRKQHSSSSSHYHPGSIGDDHNMFSNFDHCKSGEESENPFAVGGKIGRSTGETGSYEDVMAVFDDSGSEGGDNNINDVEEPTVHQSSSYFLPEGRLSSSHLFTDNAFSPRRNIDESSEKFSAESSFASEKSSTLFSEGLTSHKIASHSDGLLPVTFDDSDGPSSDSGEELPKSGNLWREGIGVFPHKETANSGHPSPMQNHRPHVMGSSLAKRENVGSNRKTWLQSPLHDLDDVEVPERNQDKKARDETQRKLIYGNFDTSQSFSGRLKSRSNSSDLNHNFRVSGSSSITDNGQRNEPLDAVEDDYSVQESGLESGKELNFGMLSGGLRNKGYQHPPYHRNLSNSSSIPEEAAAENFSKRTDELSSSSKLDDYSVNSPLGHSKENKLTSSETTVTYSDSGDDHFDDKLPQKTPSINRAPYNPKPAVEVHEISGSRTYFNSDNSDVKEDHPIKNLARRTRLGAGLSQQTKASPATSSDRSSYSQSNVLSESLATDYAVETKSTRNSYATKTQLDSQPQTSSLDNNTMAGRRSQEQAAARPLPPSRSSRVELPSKFSRGNDFQLDPPSRTKISDYSGHQKQPRSDEPLAFKPIPESKRSSREENQNSSTREQSSNPGKSAAASGADSLATPSSQGKIPSRENSINKPSHVHPKLPDYDTLTAQLLALRQKRQ